MNYKASQKTNLKIKYHRYHLILFYPHHKFLFRHFHHPVLPIFYQVFVDPIIISSPWIVIKLWPDNENLSHLQSFSLIVRDVVNSTQLKIRLRRFLWAPSWIDKNCSIISNILEFKLKWIKSVIVQSIKRFCLTKLSVQTWK